MSKSAKSVKVTQDDTQVEVPVKRKYNVPEYNVTVEAESPEQAVEIAKKKGSK